jgi:hypothetical protein
MRTNFKQSAAAISDEIDSVAQQFQTWMDDFNPGKAVRVVVACEDAVAAAQASLVLERMEGRSEANGRFLHRWWNYEDLAVTALQRMAGFEAADADIIAFAVHDGSQLPEKVIDWISQWLAMGENHPRAFLAILDSDGRKKGAARGTLSQLYKVAELGQMTFFAIGAHLLPGGPGLCGAGGDDIVNGMAYENDFRAETCCDPGDEPCLS